MADEWYYQTFGEERGPEPFFRLQEMARKNLLLPQDRVRGGQRAEWVPARTVAGLFPEGVLEDEQNAQAVGEFSDLDFESLHVADEEPDQALTESAFHRLEVLGTEPSAPSTDERWLCQILGQPLGPMSFEDLRTLAQNGELGVKDQVRRLDESEWRAARTVAGLFSGFVFLEDESTDALPVVMNEAQPPRPPVEINLGLMGALGEELEQAFTGLSSAEIPVAPPTSSAPRPVPPPAMVDQAPPAPMNEAPEPVGSSGALSLPQRQDAPALRMAAFAQQQAAIKNRSANATGPGVGAQLSELAAKFKRNPLALGVVAVLALVLIIKYVPFSFGDNNQETHDTIKRLSNTFRELRARKAPAAEFDQFTQPALAELNLIHEELEKTAGAKNRARQELYWACGNLINMLEDARQGPSQSEERFDQSLQAFQSLQNGPPLPTSNPAPPPPADPSI